MEKIIIPNSVTSIEDDVFENCNNLTIYGYADSYAQQYAAENNIPFEVIDKPTTTTTTEVTTTTTTEQTTATTPEQTTTTAKQTTATTTKQSTTKQTTTTTTEQTTTTKQTTKTTTNQTTTTTAKQTTTTQTTTSSTPTEPTAIYGDINLDGRVDITDAVLLNKACAGTVMLDSTAKKNADCNGDGEIGSDDAVVLLKFLVHLVNTLPFSE